MREKSTKSADRRRFLKMAGLGAAVAGAAVGVAGRQAVAKTPVDGATKPSAGYRETELVRRYYALARF